MNKKISTITMILILAITSLIGGLSIANAQPFMPTTKKTYPYIGLIPSSVGVNQEVLLHLGILSTTAGTIYSWEGLTVTVIKPDGTTQTLGPFATDATGGCGLHPCVLQNHVAFDQGQRHIRRAHAGWKIRIQTRRA